MPIKGGKLTPTEREFVKHYAATGDAGYAGQKAGYRGASGPSMALTRPAIQSEIRAQQLARLNNDLLPLALDNIEAILRNPKASERGKIMAAKIVIDRTAGAADGSASKEPHEMTGDELQAAINRLRREASERATPVIEHEPSDSVAEKGIFD